MNLLFGIILSSLLVVAVSQWFMGVKKSFLNQRTQFSSFDLGRISHQYLMKDFHSGGYLGIRTNDASFSLNKLYSPFNENHRYFCFNRVIFGFLASPGACYGKLPETTCQRIKKNSPVLIIYNVPQKINQLTKPLEKKDEVLSLDSFHDIQKNSLVLVSDAHRGDLFVANRVEEHRVFHEFVLGINDQSHLSRLYGKDAEVVELQTVAYYLGVPERVDKLNLSKSFTKSPSKKHHNLSTVKDADFALFRDDLLHHAQEIVPEVSDFRIEIGVQLPASYNIQHQTLPQMKEADWPYVRSVRISIVDQKLKCWNYEITLRNRIGS